MRPERLPPSRLSRLVRLCLILVSIAFLLLASREVATTIRFANMSVIAAILEKDRTVSEANLTRVVKDADLVRARGLCRTELVSAATTVLLKNMDRRNSVQDFDGWSAAVRDTETHLRFAARCMPGDSNLWLRYAALRSVIAENPDEVAAIMHLSRRLAPADGHMLFARLGFWNSYSEKTLERAAPDVVADLSTLMSRGDPCAVGRELRQVSPNLQPYVDQARQHVPAIKLKQLAIKCYDEKAIKGPFKL